MGRAADRRRARAMGLEGERRATLGPLAVTWGGIREEAGRIKVRGPGQKALVSVVKMSSDRDDW